MVKTKQAGIWHSLTSSDNCRENSWNTSGSAGMNYINNIHCQDMAFILDQWSPLVMIWIFYHEIWEMTKTLFQGLSCICFFRLQDCACLLTDQSIVTHVNKDSTRTQQVLVESQQDSTRLRKETQTEGTEWTWECKNLNFGCIWPWLCQDSRRRALAKHKLCKLQGQHV